MKPGTMSAPSPARADFPSGVEVVAGDLAEHHGIGRATMLGSWSPTSIEVALQANSIAQSTLQPAEVMCNALELTEEIRAAHP